MKLHEVPQRRSVRVRVIDKNITVPPDAPAINHGDILVFSHIDGMYSLLFTDDGEPVHLAAWTEVEVKLQGQRQVYLQKGNTWKK